MLPLPAFPRRTVQPRDATRNAVDGPWPLVRVRVPSKPLLDDAYRVDVEPAVCVRHVLRERLAHGALRLHRNTTVSAFQGEVGIIAHFVIVSGCLGSFDERVQAVVVGLDEVGYPRFLPCETCIKGGRSEGSNSAWNCREILTTLAIVLPVLTEESGLDQLLL